MNKKTTKAGATSSKLCPVGRISKSVKRVKSRAILDLDTYVPFFLASVHNKLASGASSIYRKKYGIGIVEWRIVAMLAVEQGINAQRICDVVALDKGATSKALKTLLARGYLHSVTEESDKRFKKWWLTDLGFELHENIIAIAIEREKSLITDVDPDDLEAFLRVMRIMRTNLKEM